MKKKKPHCTHREVAAQSKLFTIESLDLVFENGEQRQFERIKAGSFGAVLMVPITKDDHVLLVREYAAGIDAYDLGFPKGVIESGENMYQAANRELQEEIGCAAKRLEFIRSVSLAPGYFAARLDIILALDLFPSSLLGDEPEPLEVIKWPLKDINGLLERQDFTEARSVAALFLCQKWLQHNKQ